LLIWVITSKHSANLNALINLFEVLLKGELLNRLMTTPSPWRTLGIDGLLRYHASNCFVKHGSIWFNGKRLFIKGVRALKI